MLRALETFHFDERGLLHREVTNGRLDLAGEIRTKQGKFDQFQPFDQAERDLVRVALAVLNVDRQCLRVLPGRRSVEEEEANRLRSLRLCIPIENPGKWNSAAPLLAKLLRFMTDDQWSFEFTQANYKPGVQLSLFPVPVAQETEMALFSGGLDSVVGLWVRHRIQPRPFLALTAYGDNAKLSKRRLAFNALKDLGVGVDLMEFHHEYRQREQRHPREEKSQRTRGFVFFSIAAAMASAIGLAAVATYEAGVGALNVPTNEAQIGAQNTKAMHPWTLLLLEGLFREVLERPIRLNAPFLLQTKGEVCKQAQLGLESLAKVAMSCDETEARKSELVHCGVCTSCLLRRVALHAAIGDGDPTVYRDLGTRTHKDYDVRSFAAQAARFKEFSGSFVQLMQLDPDIRHALHYHADRGLTRHDAERHMCEMFTRQAAEAAKFLASGRAPRLPLRSKREALQ